MVRRGLLTVFLLACAGVLSVNGVSAWGVDGHHIIGRIALAEMKPETTRAVDDLLGPDDFIACSTWADEIRSQRPETYNWHFVDIPYDAYGYDPARDCKPSDRGDCIIAELERTRHDVVDVTRSKDQRREALKFLIHFVGDLHMPLHAIDNGDRGGNDVHVTLAGQAIPPRGSLPLHAVWDSALISQRGLDEAAYADRLLQEIKTTRPLSRQINVVKWAEDAHQIGVEYVYDYPSFGFGVSPRDVIALSMDYQRRGYLAVDRELELAGWRLAAMLDAVFSKQP